MQVITTIAPVILILVLGKMLSVRKMLSAESINGIKYLISNIMLPAVIFNALFTTTFTRESITLSLIVYVVFSGMMFLGLGMKHIFGVHPMGAFLLGGCEGGMFGYPLYIALYGAASLSTLLVIDLGNILFAFTVFIVFINIYNNPGMERKKALTDSLKSPLVLLTGVAIVLNVSGLAKMFLSSNVAPVYENVITVITNPVTALVLLSVGYDLSFDKKLMRSVLYISAIRFSLMALVMIFLLTVCRSLVTSQELVVAVLLYFMLPPQFITPIFVKDDAERGYVSTMISLYSLVTILAFTMITIFVPLR